MRIIAKQTLRNFWEENAIAEQPLKAWYREVEMAQWNGPSEVKRDFPSVSIVADNRLIFNIKGNRFRLIAKVNYEYNILWIRFVGTHAEYDKIDAKTI